MNEEQQNLDWGRVWIDIQKMLAALPEKLLMIAIIIIVAIVGTWLLHKLIRRVVEQIVSGVKRKQGAEDTRALAASPLASVRVVQRTRTLGTVLSNIVNVTVVIVAALLVINVIDNTIIGSFALISAAIGAGLGFGAQNIVKDVLNGLFMVIEDQLGVGDVVNLGEVSGVVERVGVRITQVRDVNGTLWFVRNGEILRVGNMSQGWARVIVDTAVPTDADIDAVQEQLLSTAQALAAEPKWRSRVMEKPEVWGIQSISPDAIVLRLVVKTRTTARDDIARELRRRVKNAFDDMDVALPSLESVILTGPDAAHSVAGAHPPKTRPVGVVNEAPHITKPRGKRPGKKP